MSYQPPAHTLRVSAAFAKPGPTADHARVDVYNRGQYAGTLTVQRGDGHVIAARLANVHQLRVEPARQTHIAASVHIGREPVIGDRREGAWIEVTGVGEQDGEPFADLLVSSIVWHEDGEGIRGPDYTVRAWPDRKWSSDPGTPPQIEVISEGDPRCPDGS